MTNSAPPNGLALIEAEMARQHDDALRSLDAQPLAETIAAAARRTGRLVLLGMGGSHMTNRAVEGLYRAVGLDATTEPLSEALSAPLPNRARVTLIASQSGDSGEVTQYLRRPAGLEIRFGLTLNPAGGLAQALPSLVGAGGPEAAYAATRSITVSLALHATVLAELGVSLAPLRAVLASPPDPDVTPALAALTGVSTVVFTARGPLVGLAEVAALGGLELARMPALGLEGGQFRHGPLELLSPSVGVIILRAAGEPSDDWDGESAPLRASGAPLVVLDASGRPPIPGAITVSLAAHSGLAALAACALPLQRLLVGLAVARIHGVGEPLRSNKVTR